MFRKIFDFISHVADFFRDDVDKPIFKRNTQLIIRPDGTWVLGSDKPDTTPKVKTVTKKSAMQNIQNTSSYYAPPPSWSMMNDVGELLSPPDFFPHKTELIDKLNKCLDMNVISTCTHTKTDQGTYILQVEIPSFDDQPITYSQLRLFVKVMENQYQLKSIQEEQVLSKISNDKSYLVVFEYDPRQKLF